MITSRTRMRTKIKKKSKKDNKELRETGASFSVGQVRQSSVIFRARILPDSYTRSGKYYSYRYKRNL